jgi:hypothetical protein
MGRIGSPCSKLMKIAPIGLKAIGREPLFKQKSMAEGLDGLDGLNGRPHEQALMSKPS